MRLALSLSKLGMGKAWMVPSAVTPGHTPGTGALPVNQERSLGELSQASKHRIPCQELYASHRLNTLNGFNEWI